MDYFKVPIIIAPEGGHHRRFARLAFRTKLGAGPGVFLYDSSALPNRKFVELLKQTAENKIPLQFDLVQDYGDDSAEIQKSMGGVPTLNLVVVARYTHAHNGIINRSNFDKMVNLLVALVEKLDARTVANLRDFNRVRLHRRRLQIVFRQSSQSAEKCQNQIVWEPSKKRLGAIV